MGIALVTGASSGIGAEFARQLAARGDDLVLVARDTDRLERLAEEFRAQGRQVEVLTADLADRKQVEKVVARLEDAGRPVDLLVNNAGFSVHSSLTAKDPSRHDLGIDVMIRAVLVLGGAAGRAMRLRGHGQIINVSSTAGFITMGSYSAIKAWVTSYTEGLSNELHGTGVTVTALCPGWVHTEFHERGGVSTSKIPGFLWLEAQPLVAKALKDAAKGRVISIPSARYGLLIFVARHAPRAGIRWVSRKISSSRRDSLTE